MKSTVIIYTISINFSEFGAVLCKIPENVNKTTGIRLLFTKLQSSITP